MMAKRVLTSDGHVDRHLTGFEAVDLAEGGGGRGIDEERGRFLAATVWFKRLRKVVLKFGKFVGPGFMGSYPDFCEISCL
jgi:metal iron transporter